MSYEDRGRQYGEVRKSNKIYISNLSMSTTEDDLRQVFDKFGPINSVTLKQKENVTFAFLQFSSNDQAEEAVNQMNGKTVIGTQIKVQFARGQKRNYGDRGGYGDRRGGYGDRGRGGFQSRGDDDRPRGPRACFNCGKEDHMIRECPEPRKQRQYNNSGGYERKGYDNRGDDRSGGNRYNSDRRDYNSRGDDDRRGGYNSRRDDRDRRDDRRDRSREDRNDRRRASSSASK